MIATTQYNYAEELRMGYNALQKASPSLRHAMVTIILQMSDAESDKMQWETDLDEISSYEDDWDMEGSAKPNTTAISNARDFFESASHENLRLYATGLGAIMFVIKNANGEIRGEIGDNNFSYYIEKEGAETEFHNSEVWNKENLSLLKKKIKNLAA
ncbi:MAG: hypothetical protein MJZ66_05675 [Bacteroidales bacterium]|nr:hypothetical protein [Bacteroidales bacterium]